MRFGIHVNKPSTGSNPRTPFPDIGATDYRIWDSGRTWRLLEATDGVFGTRFNEDVAYARAAGCELLYTAGQAPAWATGGEVGGASAGIAYNNKNPDDLDDWVAYLTYLDDTFDFEAYEIWNEIDNSIFWNGTTEQMQSLHEAAYDLLKPRGKTIVSANVSDGGVPIGSGANSLLDYLTPEIIAKSDAIAYHNYVHPLQPESLIVSLRHTRAIMRRAGAGHLPLWNTEFTWVDGNGVDTVPFSESKGAAYISRAMIANVIGGADRCYFYGVDYATSQIRMVDLDTPSTLLEPAIAFRTTAAVLSGAHLSRFRQVPPLYTVDWSKNGVRGRILWCDDDETQSVDLTEFTSGTDVLGDAITLSASYEVTHSPVFVTR